MIRTLRSRWFNFIFLSGIILQIGSSCTNEIPLYEDAGPMPLIYCLLDMDSEDQYLRLARSYRGSETYANQIPPADSLILPGENQIYIEEYHDGQLKEVYFFERHTGAVKDTGMFPIDALALYHSSFKPMKDSQYRLYVYFPNTQRVHSAETTTIGETRLIDPAPLFVREITFTETWGYAMRYVSANNSGIYQAKLKIHYAEYEGSSVNFKSFELVVPQRYVLDPDLEVIQTISPGTFFKGFADHLPVNENIERELLHMEFTLYGAGIELALFVKAQMPEVWLTASQYTNVDQGFGVFSCMSKQTIKNLQFSALTRYHLATDSVTEKLGFRN